GLLLKSGSRTAGLQKLAAGGGGNRCCGARRPNWWSGHGREVASFRQGEKWNGADVGDGSALREGYGDGRGRDVIGKFRNDENIEGAEREVRGLELAA